MKKYVIPGGAGFIGSHIAEHLAAEGHQVTILDFTSGIKKTKSKIN